MRAITTEIWDGTHNGAKMEFYTTPNTTIPNDQNAFANYCYGDMISCKEGNPTACERNNARWIN